ncbi:hypothetical protein HYG86_14910 [Alkalicella caledoniensis]|uniref:Uncharacterized protein n=1 Tax=Alkalicella caledoniensis TaxID=2731377 RepID=A0A7G9WBA2_ALKCA|nr:hypothetical protein [Alkalicella caledoniensis]QNO15964.1 hypothetical protein HYG86_14910 [Alkalicella caledoniensis]
MKEIDSRAREVVEKLQKDRLLGYILTSSLFALMVMLPFSFIFETSPEQRLALFFMTVAAKIILDLAYNIDRILERIPKKLIAILIVLIFLLTPVGGLNLSRNFHLSPEGALGLEIDHIELIEDNVYGAYWANGLEYGVAILENTLGGLRWKQISGSFHNAMPFGSSHWEATAISMDYDNPTSFYYASFFKTYEPEIKGNTLNVFYNEKTGIKRVEEIIELDGEIKPGINFFTGVGELSKEPRWIDIVNMDYRIVIEEVDVRENDGVYAYFKMIGGYQLHEAE